MMANSTPIPVQDQFLEVVDRDEAERRFRAALGPRSPRVESVPLAAASGRILARDAIATIDVPGFDRADVDGFAVRAADTFGATEDAPATLVPVGDSLPPGLVPDRDVAVGQAMPIATGAVLPRGADAVVMIEDTYPAGDLLAVVRPVTPGQHMTFAGTDIARGETILWRGQRLTARETGVLAAVGVGQVTVLARPSVAILSTGGELVAPGQPLQAGQIHDSNATVIADTVRECGGLPTLLGIVPDDPGQLAAALQSALDHDMIVISGGTSKGPGDLSYRAVAELGPPGIVVHGVALKPGKPLCLAVAHGVPIAVLPGFPTSAVFTFREFLAPVLREWSGLPPEAQRDVAATLPVRLNSARGRTEYTLVSLVARADGGWSAYPLGKGSGSVTTFGHADGFVTIPRHREYLEAGELVSVRLLAQELRPADLVVIGSHCVGLDWLLGRLRERGFSAKFMAVGSHGGVHAVARGECDLAGIHLLDAATNEYNRAFTPTNAVLRPGYRRRQGIVFRQDDARFRGVVGTSPIDPNATDARRGVLDPTLADPACRMVNRNRGSGTRVLIDQLLVSSRPDGYAAEAKTHTAVAASVAQGRADWGVAIESVATAAGLGFLPLRDEHYDFIIPSDRLDRPAVQSFLQLLDEPATIAALADFGFHRRSRD